MLLTGIALAGGTLALGTHAYRTKQPKQSLVATLSPNARGLTTETRLMSGRVKPRTIVLGGLAAGGSLLVLASASGMTPLVLGNGLVTLLRTNRYGPLLFIAADAVRPLTFFPDSLMTVAGGMVFGPIWGTVYALIGDSLSAMLAYTVGNYARGSEQAVHYAPKDHKKGHKQLIARYGQRMQDQPFASMILMRSLSLHFDAVSYLAGYLRLDWKPFLLGSMLGDLPGTLAAVFLGASLKGTLIQGAPRLNPALLAASGVMVVGGLGVANYIKWRQDNLAKVALISDSAGMSDGEQQLGSVDVS